MDELLIHPILKDHLYMQRILLDQKKKLYFTFVLLAKNKFYNTNTCGQIFEPSIHFEAEFLSQN